MSVFKERRSETINNIKNNRRRRLISHATHPHTHKHKTHADTHRLQLITKTQATNHGGFTPISQSLSRVRGPYNIAV